jgi:alpha-tubulin suppressor-like RCC1 family protein
MILAGGAAVALMAATPALAAGTWQVDSSTNPAGTTGAQLNAVYPASGTEAWAATPPAAAGPAGQRSAARVPATATGARTTSRRLEGRVRAAATGLTAVAWGGATAGELGADTLTGSAVPVAVHGLTDVTSVAAGGRHDLALLANGTVDSWGDDTYGELCNGSATSSADSEHPVPIPGVSSAVAVAAGESHSLILLANGTVMACGDNRDGELGTGSTAADSPVPVQVPGLSGVTAIAAGGEFSLALLSNGTVMSFGTNNNGQLGDGQSAITQESSNVPVAVQGLSGVTAIAAGGEGAEALLTNGTVMAWGLDVSPPAAVTGLTGVSAVAAGQNFLLALQDGTVMSFVEGSNGAPFSTPAPVPGVTGATAIAAGGQFGLALVAGGMVSAWGDDNFGQLGDGTVSFGGPLGAVTVKGLTGAKAIAAGGDQAIALMAGTSPAASGRNGPFSSIWRMAADPRNRNDDGLTVTFLTGVSAASNTDAWTVGFHSLASSQPLAEHWNGHVWRLAAVPLPAGATTAQLNGVDELSPANVWAVGSSSADGTQQPLIEHFNGTAWSVAASPDTGGGTFDSLNAIAGTGPDNLWAVGSDNGSALVEQFNGTTWALSPLPSLGAAGSLVNFTGVSADSADDAWAVGDAEGGTDNNGENVAIHWNGQAWTAVPVPCVNNDKIVTSCNLKIINRMSAVAAISPSDVWATGNQSDTAGAAGINVPYLLHWTGSAWSLVKTPNPGGGSGAFGAVGSLFNGITALSAADVWVAGQSEYEDGSFLTLTEHFNGTSWSVAPSLDPGSVLDLPDNTFSAISGVSPHTLFAVGRQDIPDPGFCCEAGLAEHSADG